MSRIAFFPDYRIANPYQTMLYRDLAAAGVELEGRSGFRPLLRSRIDAAEAGEDPGVVHLHWTSPILQRVEGPLRAYRVLAEVTGLVEAFKAAGGRLVWTVHNVISHDAQHLWGEIELGRMLTAHADLVHVMSEATYDATEPYYTIDRSRSVVIEHPSYVGEYPDWISRAGARARLGLDDGDRVLIAIGGVRPYKGLDRLLGAFEELRLAEDRLRLLVAGKPGAQEGIAELMAELAAAPGVVCRFEHLPDAELQVWMRAADLAVLPYRGILNSGVLLLAQGYGLPVVAPAVPSLHGLAEEPHVRLFDPADDASLLETIRTAIADLVLDPAARERAGAAARAYAEARPPAAMSHAFAQAVAPLLD
ncbi:glycosyltransferase [Nocardioides sp.]|uniref:glycosyltransferase n=1 Tax=Nocardioides sp. TaxID=35761 RepID=UPI0039E414ED